MSYTTSQQSQRLAEKNRKRQTKVTGKVTKNRRETSSGDDEEDRVPANDGDNDYNEFPDSQSQPDAADVNCMFYDSPCACNYRK